MPRPPGRIITQENILAAHGLAVSEYLMLTHYEVPDSRPILHRHTFSPTCVLAGRFEDIDAQLNLREIQMRGFSINRRVTGGGPMLMNSKTVGFSLITDLKSLNLAMQPEEIFEKVGRAICQGLEDAGVLAQFGSRNRILHEGKQLARLEIACDEKNILIISFHFKLDEDFEELVLVTNRNGKDLEKRIAELKEQRVALSQAGPRRLNIDKLTEAVAKGLGQMFDAPFEADTLTAEDEKKIQELEKSRYRTSEWIFRRRPLPDMTGERLKRTDAGSIQVYLSRNGSQLRNVMICGDFSSTALTIRDLEEKLRDAQIDRDTVLNLIKEELSRRNRFIVGLSEEHLANAILEAADKAKRVEEALRGDAPPSPPQHPANGTS